MTFKELYSIPHLQKEIADYKDKIREMEELAESMTAKLTGMPHASGVRDKVGECVAAIATYTQFLETAIAEKVAREKEITQYIESVDDAVTRRIMYLRFVKQLTWQQVADEIGGTNTEDSVRKRCHRYIAKIENMSYMSDNKAV